MKRGGTGKTLRRNVEKERKLDRKVKIDNNAMLIYWEYAVEVAYNSWGEFGIYHKQQWKSFSYRGAKVWV